VPKTLPKTSKAAKSRTPRRPTARPAGRAASRPAARATAKAAPRASAAKAGPRPVASRPRSEKPVAKPVAKAAAAKPVAAKPVAEPVRAATKRVHPPTAREFEAMRESLQHKRQEMLNRYKRDLRVGQETSDDGTDDIVDRANNSYHRELMFSLSDTDRVQLLQIEAALKRSENGTFGKCVHCGQPIALQRLQAIPWARLCIDCQELAEKGMLED